MSKYLMQAVSGGVGGDGALKAWSAGTADWAAAGFPGPGTALYTAVRKVIRDDVIVTAKVATLATTAQSAPVVTNNSNNDFKAAVTLIQNVQVLSIQKNFVANGVPYDATVRGRPDDKTDGSYVTLALTPDQAQLLTLASQDGKVTLTLRAFGDAKVADVAPIAEPVRIK